MADRVVITGIGAVSPWGWGVSHLSDGLFSGRTAIAPSRRLDTSRQRTHLAAEVPDTQSVAPRHLSRADFFALVAAREAVSHAGLAGSAALSRAAIFFGTSTGGMLECEEFFEKFLSSNGRRAHLSLLRSQECNGPADAVARGLGLTGAVETISSACASAALAIAAASDSLRLGEHELAVVGGSDSLCQLTYAGFNALRSVDPAESRPFRADREGLSLGEGAAVMVLETARHAERRNARVIGFIGGAGASCDAHHMTAPEPAGKGAAEAIRRALSDAGRVPSEVDFINAHGTGTPLNDAAEWGAFREVFGDRAGDIPVTSTKGSIGHLLGSAGAIEAVATLLCLMRGEVHPTPGKGPVDSAAAVRLVLGPPLALREAHVALSTSLAFGGSNAALVIESSRDPVPESYRYVRREEQL